MKRPHASRRPGPRPPLRLVARLVRTVARRRRAPALHPVGVRCAATLRLQPTGPAWGVPWLDTPGDYRVQLRWSRALGLPSRLPDGLGIALRVQDADGPGHPLDLLFTSSGSGPWARHLPLPRHDALAGPYSTLVAYRVGEQQALLALQPVRTGARVPVHLTGLRGALDAGPLTFALCAARPGGPWRRLGTLTTGPLQAGRPQATDSYDPYLRHLPLLRPTSRLAGLRRAAYAASREGRAAASER